MKKIKILFAMLLITAFSKANIIINATSTNICSGSSSTLSVNLNGISSGGAYSWYTFGNASNPFDTNPTVTVSPANAGEYYYLDYTVGGSTYTTNILINVVNIPLPTITGMQSICGAPYTETYTISNYDPTYTYNVSVSGNNSGYTQANLSGLFTVNWSSNIGAVITVTAHYMGCSISNTYTVYACCNNGIVLVNYTASNLLHNYNIQVGIVSAATLNITGIVNISINGTFIVDVPIQFDECRIYMGAGARIIINPGVFLDFQYTHLLACNAMWDGIYISDPTSTVKFNESMLEDAISGVNITNAANWGISYSIFNNNLRSVVIDNSVFNYGGTLQEAIFSCRDFSSEYSNLTISAMVNTIIFQYDSNSTHLATTGSFYYDTDYLKVPFTNRRTYSAIELKDVTDTGTNGLILGTTQFSSTNYFDYMDYGIRSESSNSYCYNAIFENIYNPNPSPNKKTSPFIAIWAKAKDPYYFITVGGYNQYESNTFYNCQIGVQTWQYNTDVVSNYFELNKNCVDIETFKECTENVLSNKMINVFSGILMQDLRIGNTFQLNHTIIDDNRITNSPTGSGLPNSNISSFGIHVSQFKVPVSVKITNNTITDPRYGIWTSGCDGVAIMNNEVDFNSDFSAFTLPSYYGIRLQGCPYAFIQENTVQKLQNQNPPPSSMVTKLNGISIEDCQNAMVKLNITQRMGSGIYASGSSPSSSFTCNTLDYCYYGFRFANADIGNQLNTGDATGNTWSNMIAGGWWIRGNVNPYINWFYQGVNFSGNVSSGGSIALQPGSTPDCIALPPPIMPMTPENREQLFGAIVRNEKSFDTLSAEFKLKDSIFAYSEFNNNNDWLNLGTDDSIYTGFYAYCKIHTIGEFQTVNDTLASDTLTAIGMNQNIPTRCTMDQNQQLVNTIYLQYVKQMNDGNLNYYCVLDSAEVNILESVAYQNPILGGNAVYQARQMLFIDVLDLEMTLRSMINNTPKSDPVNYFKIYPNPNNGSMQLNYTLNENESGIFSLYNVLGEKINTYALNKNFNVLNIDESTINSGIYFYKVYINEKLIKTDKVIISK